MGGFARLLILMALGLGLWGCATAEPVKVETAPVERATYFYVKAMQLPLKSAAEASSSTVATLNLNERVQQVERRGSWFLVRSESGQQGWANDRDLSLQPVANLYVRRWGVSLRTGPANNSKRLARLRANDQVTLLGKNPQGWARVTVVRTGKAGWVEFKDLSTSKVVMHRAYRPKHKAAGTEEEAAAETATPPSAASGLGPKAANAATLPAKPAPAIQPRKAKPGMFEPF